MGTVWNVTLDLKLKEGTDVRAVAKELESKAKGNLPERCETYKKISFIFRKLDEDLNMILDTMETVNSLFVEDAFDGSYSVGYALYNAFNDVFDSMPFEPGSKIIFESWEAAGGRYVIERRSE